MVQLNPFRQTLSGDSDWPVEVALAQHNDLHRQRRPLAKVCRRQFDGLALFRYCRNRLWMNHQPEAGSLTAQDHHVPPRRVVLGLVEQVVQHHPTVAITLCLKPPRHIAIGHIKFAPAWVVF